MHRTALTLLVLLAFATSADAWTVPGHSRVSQAAMKLLPDEVPAFFRDDAVVVGHMAADPDAMKQRGLVALRAAESPEHYLDLEFLGGQSLPVDRFEYLELLERLDLEPNKVGFLPYAITEGTQRLTVAFAEHRQWPDDETIQAKIAFYAGLLSHYAGDLAQPLHTTIHHDGMTSTPGVSPHTGIHLKMDRLFELLPAEDTTLLNDLEAESFENVWTAFHAQLQESFARIDRAYALEEILDDFDTARDNPTATEFARERYRVAAHFIASLFLTAWEDSAEIELPWWLEYPGTGTVGRPGG